MLIPNKPKKSMMDFLAPKIVWNTKQALHEYFLNNQICERKWKYLQLWSSLLGQAKGGSMI